MPYLRVDCALRKRRGSSKPDCRAVKKLNILLPHTGLRPGCRHDRAWNRMQQHGLPLANQRCDATKGERRYWGGSRTPGSGRDFAWACPPVGGESRDLELLAGMTWWRGVLRSVWSSLSKEVREHVGTDHLGNKYYYVAEYKNWRGESQERLPVAAHSGRVTAAVLWGRAVDVLGLVVALGNEVWTQSSKICQRVWAEELRERLCASA